MAIKTAANCTSGASNPIISTANSTTRSPHTPIGSPSHLKSNAVAVNAKPSNFCIDALLAKTKTTTVVDDRNELIETHSRGSVSPGENDSVENGSPVSLTIDESREERRCSPISSTINGYHNIPTSTGLWSSAKQQLELAALAAAQHPSGLSSLFGHPNFYASLYAANAAAATAAALNAQETLNGQHQSQQTNQIMTNQVNTSQASTGPGQQQQQQAVSPQSSSGSPQSSSLSPFLSMPTGPAGQWFHQLKGQPVGAVPGSGLPFDWFAKEMLCHHTGGKCFRFFNKSLYMSYLLCSL